MPPKKTVLSLSALPVWADGAPAVRSKVNWKKELKDHPYRGLERSCTPALNAVLSIVKDDITRLRTDGIVNAAAVSLGIGGGGIDGAIRAAAGSGLSAELSGKKCAQGEVVPSGGHRLPAKHILHTVSPRGSTVGGDEVMQKCYENCLLCAEELGLRSVAFCCLGNGMFKFPAVRGAHIALSTVRAWLEARGPGAMDRIVMCTFSDLDYEIYLSLAPHYFPLVDNGSQASCGEKAIEVSCEELGEAKAMLSSAVASNSIEDLDRHLTDVEKAAQAALKAFQRWDTDGKGKFTAAEMKMIFENLGMKFTEEGIQALFDAADANKDGAIDYLELLAWLFEAPDAHTPAEYEPDDLTDAA